MNCKVEQRGIGKPMLVVDITNGGFNCSHWGLTDLYEECEKNLRDMLNTGVDFETEWCGSKKELLSARYRRRDGKVWVDVNQWIDDLWEEGDLIYDATCTAFDNREDIEIPDDGVEYIKRIASECELDDTIVLSECVGANASYEDCMKAVEILMEMTDRELTGMYERLCDIVHDYVVSEGLDKKGSAE